MSGYVIQGGGYTADLSEKPTRPPIQNEATNGLSNQRGTVAMARTRALRSATSQFFINLADNRSLDHRGYSPDEFGYAVFGRVIGGMDVVDRIALVQTTVKNGMENLPVTPVDHQGDDGEAVTPAAARHLPHHLRQPDWLRDHHPAAAVLRADVRRVAARHRAAVRLVLALPADRVAAARSTGRTAGDAGPS